MTVQFEDDPPKWRCNMLAGDWNAVEEQIDRETNRHIVIDDILALEAFRGSVAPDFCEFIDGFRERYLVAVVYTYYNNASRGKSKGGKTRIDRIFARDNWIDLVTKR